MDNGTSLSLSSPSNNGSFNSDDQQSMGGFSYGIGISLGLLILVVLLTLVSYQCTRMQIVPHEHSNTPIHRYSFVFSASVHRHDRSSSLESGLDDYALGTFPKFPYSQAKDNVIQQGGGGGGESCSICLADYKKSESLRMLPDYGHAFHVKCVPSLRSHPTWPVCRNSPVPSSLATPLVEVTPFAVGLS